MEQTNVSQDSVRGVIAWLFVGIGWLLIGRGIAGNNQISIVGSGLFLLIVAFVVATTIAPRRSRREVVLWAVVMWLTVTVVSWPVLGMAIDAACTGPGCGYTAVGGATVGALLLGVLAPVVWAGVARTRRVHGPPP